MINSYVVLLHDDESDANQQIREQIAQAFPGDDHIRFTDDVFFVHGDDLEVADVVARLGNGSPVLVLNVRAPIAGSTWTRIWAWLRAIEGVRV